MNVLLFVGDRRCSVAIRKRAGLDFKLEFANTEEGVKQFEHFLDGGKNLTVGMLADLVEEDYRTEMIPHLGWRDRKSFRDKRLAQQYPHTPFRNALVQGGEGKKDRVLFSALTSPNMLLPWIESLRKRRIPLSGVSSVAMLSGRLIGGLKIPCILLLTYQNGTGWRQSFFSNGHLDFSRLTLVRLGDDPVATVKIESGRTIHYLHALNLLPEQGALAVCILCGADMRKRLETVLEDNPSVRHVFLDLEQTAKRVGFGGGLPGSDALPLFLHLCARDPNRYGSEEHVHLHALKQWQSALYAMSLALVLGGAVLAGIDMWRAVSLHSRAGVLAVRADEAMRRYRALLPPDAGPDSPQKMKAAVMLAQRIESAYPNPDKVLAAVSRALAPFPNVRIDRLAWQVSKNPEDAKESAGEIGFDGDSLGQGRNNMAIFIDGEIAPFDGSYRHANETVERFCAALGKFGMKLDKVTLPLDLNPEGSLAGKPGQASGKATFSVMAIWREKA